MRKIQRFTSFLVGLCIPFHTVTIPLGRPMSLSVLSMMLYALTLVPFARDVLRIKKDIGATFLIPLYYVLLLSFINVFYKGTLNTPIFNTTFFLCVLLFFLFLMHIKHDYKGMRYCIWGLSAGGVLLALFAMRGIGVEIDATEMRLRIFGLNSNMVGILLAISGIIIINEFVVADALNLGAARWGMLLTLVPITSTLLLTASRTAFLIFGLSIISVILFYPSRNKGFKFAFVIISVIALFYASRTFLSSESVMAERFLDFMEHKDLSGRDDLWKDLLPLFYRNPIWGYGETGYAEISENVIGIVSDANKGPVYGFSPHNVIVEVLIYSGIIGLTMWLIFWWKIFRCSLYSFKYYKELTPIMLMIPLLASIVSGQILMTTHAYIVYAYAYSEYCRLRHQLVKLNKI